MRQRIGLLLGPALLALMLLLPAPAGMSGDAWRTAAVGAFLATWWLTEAIPIAATALVPLVIFPLLGVLSASEAAAPYANPVVFLFMGGFMLALAMQRQQLHRRIALRIVRFVGTRPDRLVLGFLCATAFLSMWVSNTATAVMMLPIALSVVQLVAAEPEGRDRNLAIGLMLAIAYAASIGGLGTLIGTPPNALFAAFMLETYGVQVGFARWLLVGVPLVLIGIPLTWLLLTRVAFPVRTAQLEGAEAAILAEYERLGPMSAGERRIAILFLLTAAAWIAQPLLGRVVPGLSDMSISIAGALLTFLVPVGDGRRGQLMDWKTAETLPWGVLVLFGGGLALAEAVTHSGLAEWIGSALGGLERLPMPVVVLIVTTVIVFLGELASNTATAAAFLPLVGPLAVGLGENPLLLAVPAAIAASCSFMLPAGTPPNAIVFGSGYVTVPQMSRAGWWLNLTFIALIVAFTYSAVLLAFDVQPGIVPAWAVPGAP
jgi:sodium-dependent dicarboxylate transporter 2/3/5